MPIFSIWGFRLEGLVSGCSCPRPYSVEGLEHTPSANGMAGRLYACGFQHLEELSKIKPTPKYKSENKQP